MAGLAEARRVVRGRGAARRDGGWAGSAVVGRGAVSRWTRTGPRSSTSGATARTSARRSEDALRQPGARRPEGAMSPWRRTGAVRTASSSVFEPGKWRTPEAAVLSGISVPGAKAGGDNTMRFHARVGLGPAGPPDRRRRRGA